MAGSVNKVIILGRAGKNPEVRYTQSNQSVASFSVATSRTWLDKNGERQESTEWHNITAWGKLAEICRDYVVKGKQVYIEGRLQTRSWDDKEGNKRYTTEIVAQTLVLLGSAGEGKGGAEKEIDAISEEDDIPF